MFLRRLQRGHAGGALIALACDVPVASASATFGFSEVKLGAMAGATGTQRLPQLVGPGHALRLMLTGRTIDAAEALRIGLVEEVVEDEALLPRVLQLAQEIAAVSPAPVRATKRCVREGLAAGYEAGMRLEADVTAPLGLTADAIEGKTAFVEKRAPRFQGAGAERTNLPAPFDAEKVRISNFPLRR